MLAYLRSQLPPHNLHIPLANLPRADLALRTEMTAVLKHAGLGLRDLLTLSDLPELKPEETRWLLVDHNSLTGQLKTFSKQVVGCIDHHNDESTVPSDAQPRTVEPCGSCMSLIVEESRGVWEELATKSEDGSEGFESEKLARLAIAPILIDTINMTAKDKIRDKDPRAVAFLTRHIGDETFDATKYFDEISAVKEDISGLGFRDIFRKDYKEWEEGNIKLGISCVVQNFDYMLDQASSPGEVLDAFSQWAKERELDLASIMTTSHPDDEFQRHLLVWGLSSKGEEALHRFIQISDRLQLQTWRSGKLDDGRSRKAWRQMDLTASRKQVGPLLREAMKQMGDVREKI